MKMNLIKETSTFSRMNQFMFSILFVLVCRRDKEAIP